MKLMQTKQTPVVRLLSCMMAGVLLGPPLASAVQFYDISQDGQAAFLDAVGASFFLGSETFESATVGDNQEVALDGPILAPGLANGPFPEGTDVSLGITLQVNTLGGAPSSLNPGGLLFAIGSDVDNAGFIRVGPENAAHSLDILLEPPGFLGEVTGFRLSVFATTPTGEIRVYNTNNDLLASQLVTGLGSEAREFGIVAPANQVMFRVNFWSDGGWGEAGNLQMYAVPEPSTWLLLLAGVAGMALFGLRSRRARPGSAE
jgi:hypothetical protein